MKREAKENGLNPIDVFLISASRGQGVPEVMEAIDHYREEEMSMSSAVRMLENQHLSIESSKKYLAKRTLLLHPNIQVLHLMRLKFRLMTGLLYLIRRASSTAIKWRTMSAKMT